jgi:predicted dehydrogenase
VIELGIIGYKNHASRLIKLINEIDDCIVNLIYHPNKILDVKHFTNDLNDLFDCDAIFVSSPNQTHYQYLEKLFQKYDGYIFCEKPPVTSTDHLNILTKIPTRIKNKLFFNFNYRFSKINDCLVKIKNSENIGKINHINIVATQGLAFKNEYLDSWRSDGKTNLHNILETVSIHYLDLLNYNFGKINNIQYYPKLISNNGTSYDTNYITLEYEHNVTASIFNSYASPYINQISILGTNGFLNIFENQQKLFSPRDTFNSKGLFITPSILENQTFIFESEYENSLKNSINYFLNHVRNNTLIPIEQFDTSILSNKSILNIKNSF